MEGIQGIPPRKLHIQVDRVIQQEEEQGQVVMVIALLVLQQEVKGVQVIHGPSTERRMPEVVAGVVCVKERVVQGVVGTVNKGLLIVIIIVIIIHYLTHQVPLEVVEVVVLQEPTAEMD